MTHERNIFLILEEDMLLSKRYFIPMMNNSRLMMSPRLQGQKVPPVTDKTGVMPHTTTQLLKPCI